MERRINEIRKRFKDFGIAAFLVSDIVHIRYLTGLKLTEKGDAKLLITKDNHYLITDARYEEQALKENAEAIIGGSKEQYKKLAELIKNLGGKTGFEAEDLTFAELRRLKKELSNSVVPDILYREFLSPVENLIENISSIKTREEIKKIRRVVEITDHIFQEHILDLLKPGIRETELAAEISYLGKKHGAEDDAFGLVVLFGPNSSLPHGDPARIRKLRKGDIIQLDFGYFYQGYCSDFSRVLVLGKPTEEQKKIHKIVFEAQKRAIETVKPGMKWEELDKIARDFIEENGYKFVHGLGHGIGIKIHTIPRLGDESKDVLKLNQVFTIEPGIYIPGWGGMRIEDDVLATKDGCEVLTKSPRNLVII